MNKLSRSYGRLLSTIIISLVGFWLVCLIALPQFFMLERSIWEKKSSEEELTVKLEIDRLYNEVTLAEQFDLPELEELPDSTESQQKIAALQQKVLSAKARIDELESIEVKPVKEYTANNYAQMSGLHFKIFIKTIAFSLLVTLLSFLFCYPIAYAIAHVAAPKWASLLLIGVVVPYSINELLRIYSWLMILDYHGIINTLLSWVGITNLETNNVIPFLESPASVFVAMIYAYILFMMFPIYNTIETLDKNQIEASRDLGAGVLRTHLKVIIPHAKPGIAVGCIMTFMLSVGSYAVPKIISRGKQEKWFSELIYDKFYESFNWNVGAAYAFTLLFACIVFVFVMMKIFKVGIEDIAK